MRIKRVHATVILNSTDILAMIESLVQDDPAYRLDLKSVESADKFSWIDNEIHIEITEND